MDRRPEPAAAVSRLRLKAQPTLCGPMMGIQSIAALVTSLLVIARAVSILR